MMRALRWWSRRPRASHLHVTVYSRDGCHACHEAIAALVRQRRRHRFRLEVVDVDEEGDPQLLARHGDWVPVVLVDGKVRSRGPMNRLLMERLLNAEARLG